MENGKQPPDHIRVRAELHMKEGLAIFTEESVNGLVMVEPKVIKVPIQSIMIMGAQALLAMNGVAVGAVAVARDGSTKPPQAPGILEQ